MINTIISRPSSSDGRHARIGNRRRVSVSARLTWRDASGTLRFVSVMTRDVSDVDVFVECQVPASIPLYRLAGPASARWPGTARGTAGGQGPFGDLSRRSLQDLNRNAERLRVTAIGRENAHCRSSRTPRARGRQLSRSGPPSGRPTHQVACASNAPARTTDT